MKNFIIIVLLASLIGLAFYTRPTPASFKEYAVAQAASSNKNVIAKGLDQLGAARLADTAEFRDRYLWVDVVQDGKTLYTGALGHWFNHAAVADQVTALKQKV